ncbi:DNA mismatch repair protein MutS [Candidatus Puniceispirillum sp.]|uniref:DNA mismatch repair protein MutS n=1 Tax=Candidatus Puniceispirillum sp. TaxID=2026719 RepID=UPI003F6A2ADC
MMAQYLSVKESHPDSLLFYRMGDFYEMFFEDAEIAAAILGIALTKRGKNQGEDIPMCGVPVHAVDAYMARLIKAGHRVAVCEQTESPEAQKQRGAKGPLKRDVVRVMTPGTLTEDDLLEPRAHNFLAALGRSGAGQALAWADMSTGDFFVEDLGDGGLSDGGLSDGGLEDVIVRLTPSELIVPQGQDYTQWSWADDLCITEQAPSMFDSSLGTQALHAFFGVSSLDGYGDFSRAMLSAAGALLGYIEATQIGNMPRLQPLQAIAHNVYLDIDPATRRSLELTRTLTGERKGSLLHAVDRTMTAAGSRMLTARLAAPLCDLVAIVARQDLVSWFIENETTMTTMRDKLRVLPDMQRAVTRLTMGHGGPRDLAALETGLRIAETVVGLIRQTQMKTGTKVLDATLPARMEALLEMLVAPLALADKLAPALADELPFLARDGGFVRVGYDQGLDDVRQLRDESRRLMAALQARYATDTDIASLKIKHNNVLGYHVDVRATHADKLMQSELFIHRQTTAQTVRFTTTELAEMERDMAAAAGKALAKELEIFEALTSAVTDSASAIGDAATALAELDVAGGAAVLARDAQFVRPTMRDAAIFEIDKGRHPVIEMMLPAQTPFIPNDCQLAATVDATDDDKAAIWLLTGPNMAGKSTFLRQNAHIIILAQAGLFVPADRAVIGIVDRLFSRVGASDDLAKGRSTFMVEMVETAAILNRATPRSFVILDEIGRGTATYDGLAIAWATLEHLHDVNHCRTLFATHYHELTHLQQAKARMLCHSMQVREWQGDIVFLHRVIAGAADRSYGVHVARLAGLPHKVLGRAEQILAELEAGKHGAVDVGQVADNLPLFDYKSDDKGYGAPAGAVMPSAVLEAIDAMLPDTLTPRAAMNLLYELKALRAKDITRQG